MNVLRQRVKLISWIALVAMLALVLTPSLARALSRAQAGQEHWVEICTQHGVTRVALQGADAIEVIDGVADEAVTADLQAAAAAELAGEAAQLQATGNLEHCPDCSLASHELAPPPAHTSLVPNRDAHYLAPLFLRAPYTLFAWRGPRSRAPPLTA